MKRVAAIVCLVSFGFVVGWIFACVVLQRGFSERQVSSQLERDNEIKTVRQCIYGLPSYHHKGISPESDEQLDRLDFSQSKAAIVMSYVNDLSRSRSDFRISSDGIFSITTNGVSREVATLDSTQCAALFKRVISSGVLNYSVEVVQMKCDLKRPEAKSYVNDASTVGFLITVPELDVEKEISIYAPDIELRNYPDIIEFQLIAAIEKDILDLIPKDDPYWK